MFLVETGEGRTPRPEGPISGYTTSLFGDLFSPPEASTDGVFEKPADQLKHRLIGVLRAASRTSGACIPASGNNGEQT